MYVSTVSFLAGRPHVPPIGTYAVVGLLVAILYRDVRV
jgi:hypothetical protein